MLRYTINQLFTSAQHNRERQQQSNCSTANRINPSRAKTRSDLVQHRDQTAANRLETHKNTNCLCQVQSWTRRGGPTLPYSQQHSIWTCTGSVKYLGLYFDRRLNWKAHITKKRKQTDLKAKEINWLIGRKSNLSIENKLLVYKAVIKPIWTYEIELWGCASKSNTAIMQRAQSKRNSFKHAAWSKDSILCFWRRHIVCN